MTKQPKSVLLVVDVQVGVMDGTWNSDEVVKNIEKVIDSARANEIPIIWVQHSDEELIEGTPEWQIVPQLSPKEGELLLGKQFNSSFQQTGLEDVLSGYGATHLVLVGAATNWCIRATAFSALERGYDLTLVKDAHTTEDMDTGDGTTIRARDIVRELNVGIHWVRYPDRKNEVASADDVEFRRAAT